MFNLYLNLILYVLIIRTTGNFGGYHRAQGGRVSILAPGLGVVSSGYFHIYNIIFICRFLNDLPLEFGNSLCFTLVSTSISNI